VVTVAGVGTAGVTLWTGAGAAGMTAWAAPRAGRESSAALTGVASRSGLATTNNVATVRRTAVSLVRWNLRRNLVEFRISD
jgi:hypothetical protein